MRAPSLRWLSDARAAWSGLRRHGRVASLLRVPLFYKVLLANAVLVFLVAVGSTAFAVERLHAGTWPVAFWSLLLVAIAGAVATLPAYAAILRLALAPLEQLEQTAAQVEQGDLEARAVHSVLADPKLSRLTEVFNRLLDSIAADRERLRAMAARAFRAQEAERTRIAQELQEETAQTLSALMLQLRVARQTDDPERRGELLGELREGLAEITDRMRGVARALKPPALADLGPAAALESYARTLASNSVAEITVEAEDIRGLLSDEGELALYRIAQEAVSNAVRHGQARHVHVRIEQSEGGVETRVEDDGCGFDVEEQERTRPCLGLFGMRERALYAGGTLELDSQPGEGTRLRLRIPTDVAETLTPAPAALPTTAQAPPLRMHA